MSGKMAVILCGGSSEVEMYENREKFVDALNSTKLAMKTVILSIKTKFLPKLRVCFLEEEFRCSTLRKY